MAGAKEASSSSSNSSSRVFGHKYKLDRDSNVEDEESGSVSMDILGASSMELDPQVWPTTNPFWLNLNKVLVITNPG